jgi:hypothetical protein
MTVDPVTLMVLIYLGVSVFIFGFGVGDEISFRNPNYVFVAVVAVFWPIFVCYGVAYKLILDR